MRAIPVPVVAAFCNSTNEARALGRSRNFRFLRGGGAPRAPAVSAARHAGAANASQWAPHASDQERKQRLQELLSEQPDATLAELGARMDRSFRTSTIDLWLRQTGLEV